MTQALEPAHDRTHEHVLDRETGTWVSLTEYIGVGDYGEVIEKKRVALRLELNSGELRYVCPWCGRAMTLASRPIQDRTVRRFYFKHQSDDGSCTGSRGQSSAVICARKFAHCKEGALHKLFKSWLLESLNADTAFSRTDPETRWKDMDGVRWRQPDVQSTWGGQRVAFEAQLSTTFLHVITERMAFYERNRGRLLWLFRDLEPDDFRLAEDDIFFSNNRNAFRVTEQTVALSREHHRFALECVWHEPVAKGLVIAYRVQRQIVFYDQLTFDVSSVGVPRTYYFDYDSAVEKLNLQKKDRADTVWDQELRDELEALLAAFPKTWDANEHRWNPLKEKFRRRHLQLPKRIYDAKGPFYLLMAAYSAKRGEVVGSKLKNFAALANSLFERHKDALWVFSVLMEHYDRAKEMNAHGDMEKWKKRRNAYRLAWKNNDPAFAPNHRFDDLLKFLFPNAPTKLLRGPTSGLA